jgi:WD40 repeat protein
MQLWIVTESNMLCPIHQTKLARIFCVVSFACLLKSTAIGQSTLPVPDKILFDAKHKEQKSGVESNGNVITIRTGVGTPSSINVLSFSRDGKLLAAGKDYGRVVIWDMSTGAVIHVIDSGQGIVSAVAISPDNQVIATAGSEKNPTIALWNLTTGKILRTFDVSNPVVQRLEFAPDGRSLIVRENGTAYVLDTVSGSQKVDLSGERLPVLSSDGKTLMTVQGANFILRSSTDWTVLKTFPKPAKYAWPLALDTQQDIYIYGDSTEKQGFIAARISSNSPLQEKRQIVLPQFNPSAGFFAAISPSSDIVFGHSGGRLWGWNVNTGKTCVSQVLYSESGQLSSDGRFLVGAIDNGFLSKDKIKPGVEIWDVLSLIKACEL